ncbi:MAG: polysaccharide export protein [Deltaproteobacteria bacterium]|nr:MAG: polysaccharide export protein [Deltaproteobacteria bacterium]
MSRYLKSIIRKIIPLILIFVIIPLIAWSQDYLIQERDKLKIQIYEHPDLSVSVRVSGDGLITFPLLGQIKVVGLTEKQVERIITNQLSNGYIINPQVTVLVEEYKDYIYITGEVNKPGAYPYNEGMTVIKAIILAGGMTKSAKSKKIKIMRNEEEINNPNKDEVKNNPEVNIEDPQQGQKKFKTIKVNMEDLVKPDDIIIVPERFF